MIIDPSDDSRLHLKDLLLSKNHDVVYDTGDGLQAIQRYFMIKPEILFLDLVGSDGLSILKKIHQKDQMCKIIMLTTNDKMDILEECLRLGAMAFVSKPFEPDDVLSVISFAEEIQSFPSLN